jgi:cell division protein FtsI/penicillin-binding protein 2
MNPYTGAVMAMCSAPDFDPANVGKIKAIGVLNNPATFYEYEPGSIFKPLTLAAGIDAGKILPETTYVDTGLETIDGFPIRNSDKEAHGVQTMKDVLDKSLNTGTIFVQRQLGRESFQEYVKDFGLGQKTGIDLKSEVPATIASLDRKGKVFAATASFGQGITTTPIQMTAAYAALGNGGLLMKPYIVSEIIRPDGKREVTKPQVVRRVIKPQTSQLISAMMVDVVEHGHGKRAGVPGYFVAGKTGTAQVSDPNGRGYLKDETIGSFAGFAPADHPAFVMLIKIEGPKTVQFAESSAGPIFGELSTFLLSYLQVPPERPIRTPPPTPSSANASSTRP